MKFTFGTIMGGIAPIRNASKARFLDLILVAESGPGAGPAKDLSIFLLTKYQP
jgi:hypothetical protein